MGVRHVAGPNGRVGRVTLMIARQSASRAAEVAAERRRARPGARRRGCPAEGCLAVSRGSASLG